MGNIDLDRLPTVEELERDHFQAQLDALEMRRDRKAAAELDDDDQAAAVAAGTAELRSFVNEQRSAQWGGAVSKAFADFIRTGEPLSIPGPGGVVSKAALVEDATGEFLIPTPVTIDLTQRAREVGTIRSLADVRTTGGSKQRASLLSAATTGWGKLETGTAATDAAITVAATAPDPIAVFDLTSLALIGIDELADGPASAVQSITDAIGVAIGIAEDAAFANGTGSGQPSGLALAANVALVPAGQKTAASASNTPVLADVIGLPWKLPTMFRDRASWLMHPTAAGKVAAITWTNGAPLWPNPGNPDPTTGGGLMGWPAYVVDGLPDPATAGTTDASVWFSDVKSCYRVVDRQRTTVQVLRQRYAELGMVGLIVRHRVGGDMVRPTAAAIYTM